MAIICPDYNILFVMTPRTACTAIGKLLTDEVGGRYIPEKDLHDSNGNIILQRKHSTIGELLKHGLLTKDKINSLHKGATVRNPFDTLVSLYFKQRDKYQPLLQDENSWVSRTPSYAKNMQYALSHTFSEWVTRKAMRQIAKRILGEPRSMYHKYTEGIDFVLRYESIESDLNTFTRSAGLGKELKIPVVNRTLERPKSDYHEHYTRIARFLVSLAFHDDIKRYGYKY